VSLAQNSSVAIVFASDNYGNEEHDSTTLNLPNNQDALISAVAAANPHTIVVLNDNSAILMPWLNQVAGVFEGFYDGQEWGTAIAALLFGDVDPSGKLPVTFPTSLTALPASTAAQWPGTNSQINYSEGLDVGYRWYDAQNVTPLFPFGYGLSYTSFSYSNLHAGALSNGQATVTATVTNTGSRAGTDVAQLYVADPAAAGEPPHQLKGFQRVTLNPGASATVTFNRHRLRPGPLGHGVKYLAGQRGQLPDPGRRLLAEPAAVRHAVRPGRHHHQRAVPRRGGRGGQRRAGQCVSGGSLPPPAPAASKLPPRWLARSRSPARAAWKAAAACPPACRSGARPGSPTAPPGCPRAWRSPPPG